MGYMRGWQELGGIWSMKVEEETKRNDGEETQKHKLISFV